MNWIGAILLVVCSYVCGVKLSLREGEKLQALESLVSFLEFIQRRINSSRTPLYSIFGDFKDDYLESIGFLPLVRSCRSGLPLLWQEAVLRLPLEENISSEMIFFGKDLGGLPLEDQTKRLNGCLEILKEARTELRESFPKKQKSIRTVALLMGVMAAIILL